MDAKVFLALLGMLLLAIPAYALLIHVSAQYPVYINDTLYPPGEYNFTSPVFIYEPQFLNATTYAVSCYYYNVSNQLLPTSIGAIYLNSNATVSLTKCQVYYLLVFQGYPVTGYVQYITPFNQLSQVEETIGTGFYPAGAVIKIPATFYVVNSTYEVYIPEQTIRLNMTPYPYTEEYIPYYYVYVPYPVPAVINGKPSWLTSGFYKVGTTVVINSTLPVGLLAYYNITATPRSFTVSGPVTVHVAETLVYVKSTPTSTVTTITTTTTTSAVISTVSTTTVTMTVTKPTPVNKELIIVIIILALIIVGVIVDDLLRRK